MEEILTLDQIVTEFVKDESNQEYIEFLDKKIIPICEKILSKQPQELEKREWSRKVDINESIENIYQFLKQEIDPYFANQFMNIIRQERYGNVKVEILPKSEYKDYIINEIDKKGRVHILFNETPYDMFVIIHEMIHKMNRVDTIIDNKRYQTKIAEYFKESPSVMAEKILGQWLVKNKKISHNDLKMVENDRLKDSKNCVREVLIQAELIRMKQLGKELTSENVLQMLTEKANSSNNPIAEVFKQETEEPLVISFILSKQEMTFFEGQQYVMAQHLVDSIKNRENHNSDFKWLHEVNADKDLKVEDIIEAIDDYNTDPKKLDNQEKIANTVVREYIANPKSGVSILNLEQMKSMCEGVLRQPYPEIEQEEWSRKIDINESIEYNYKFLKTISPMLAEQFLNILNQNDDNDKRVSILPFSNEYECEQSMIDGKVFLYYTNTPKDIFTVLHEMIHAMSFSGLIRNGVSSRSYGQSYISEVPTHIIENLLGKWLVKNQVITQNDYNKYKKWRLQHSKKVSCKLLIEKALIDMKHKKGLYITKKRVDEIIKNKCYINNPKDFRREELVQCYNGLSSILISEKLGLNEYQRYVIGQYIADKVENENNPEKAFLRFHNLQGNVNLSLDRILRIIRKDYQQEDIDRS